ncbi:MAG TPA: hypothetical protein VMN58_10585 [Acidimicrobiales bacterium]|nr:hypothetical protein [Acidimicrobiales bacterium]
MALSSTGSAVLLGGLLVVVVRRPASAFAVAGAVLAVSVRWGSSSLSGLAGAQAVLGPAGLVGSRPAVASAWLAATALVLAVPSARWARATSEAPPPGPAAPPASPSPPSDVPGRRRAQPLVAASRAPAATSETIGDGRARGIARRRWPRPPVAAFVGAVVLGLSAAMVVAGPSAAGDPVQRGSASLAGIVVALGATALPWRRLVPGLAVVAGAGAVGAAALAVSGSGVL